MIYLKENESDFAYVMSWDGDKNHYLEKKMNVRDVTDYFLKYIKGFDSSQHSSTFSTRQSWDYSIGRNFSGESMNGNQNINVHLISDEKLTSNQRKRCENQIRNQLTSISGKFSCRTRLEIIGVHLDEQKVKELSLNFKMMDSSCNSDNDFKSDRYATRNQFSSLNLQVTLTFPIRFAFQELGEEAK